MEYTAFCNEADCSWEETFDSNWAAVEGLSLHCLDEHPEAALEYPVVQYYLAAKTKQIARSNGTFVISNDYK